jgi:hypothetical protein
MDAFAAVGGASLRIRKFFIREEALRRGLEKDLPPPACWMGGRCPAPRLLGGRYPFLENFQIGTSFSNLIF